MLISYCRHAIVIVRQRPYTSHMSSYFSPGWFHYYAGYFCHIFFFRHYCREASRCHPVLRRPFAVAIIFRQPGETFAVQPGFALALSSIYCGIAALKVTRTLAAWLQSSDPTRFPWCVFSFSMLVITSVGYMSICQACSLNMVALNRPPLLPEVVPTSMNHG